MSTAQGNSPRNWIDVDVMTPGPFSSRERETFAQWYREFHGDGNLDSAGFVSFWLNHADNEVLKSFRRWVEASVQNKDFIPAALSLAMTHTYTVLGWGEGAQYELICALKLCGVNKLQVLETLAFAFIHSGPKGMSQVASLCDQYLQKWKDTDSSPKWPEGWKADPEALRSGIDLRTKGMTAEEVRKLEDWYRKHQGTIPSYVPFLEKWNPEGLKAFRVRYETCIQTLPKQLVPLMTLNTAAVLGKVGAMRRAAHQAKQYGVTRSQMLSMLLPTIVYTGDLGTETTVDAVQDLVEDWER